MAEGSSKSPRCVSGSSDGMAQIQHPNLLRVLAYLHPSSPGVSVSDPHQPARGCLKEIKDKREPLVQAATGATKLQILRMKEIDNCELRPVAKTECILAKPSASGLHRRRASCNLPKSCK